METIKTGTQEPAKVRTRIRRSPERIVELMLEAERTGQVAAICRREGIAPSVFYRWKAQFKKAAVVGFKQTQKQTRERQGKIDPALVQNLQQENQELKDALCKSTIELSLLKKRVNCD
jgi:transposase